MKQRRRWGQDGHKSTHTRARFRVQIHTMQMIEINSLLVTEEK